MSVYTTRSRYRNPLLAFLDIAWRHSPHIRGDAARFYVYEVAQAASRGLVTTWQGTGYGIRWLITSAGLKLLAPRKR